ncbi:50S ribosomal protein L18e [Candidatus Pacearchaeota archaeon]|jgi:large subunit ribosomal protein L18e|nr:50S ribosomal protein L18e [Candidatus Pacearchaeota archaeon]|tara:strand:+ start:1350 stop:1733 length:384 start_codon:yes stop_codon:yes gene_type:complete
MNEISKTTLKKRSKNKTAPELVETISLALKNPAWLSVTKILSGPTRSFSAINLDNIDSKTKAGDTVLIPGKVLSKGELTKKLRIVALSFSEKVKEKVKESKSELVTILEEIKKNPKFEGIKLITNTK